MASIIKVDQIQESTAGVGTNFSNTGSASVPTISIGNQTNKGFYHSATDKIGITIAGQKVGEIGSGYGGFTGNIIQVKNFSSTYNYTTTNSSDWTSNVLSASGVTWETPITPFYSTSKILVIYNINVEMTGGTNFYFGIRIARKIAAGNYSEIFSPGDRQFGWASGSIGGGYIVNNWTTFYYDSPSTTSIVTYRFPLKLSGTSTLTAYINGGISGTNISSITLLEVQL